MHHLKSEALIFCFTYGIESLRVYGWSYDFVFVTYSAQTPAYFVCTDFINTLGRLHDESLF